LKYFETGRSEIDDCLTDLFY